MAPRPEFAPDPTLSHDEMAAMQREVAAAARFEDDLPFDRRAVDGALVAGVDQAFTDGHAVSAVVASRGTAVVERSHAVTPLAVPYIPGLLAFREGGPILDALDTLAADPDLLLFDGSGRIHYRQAGLATHVGVTVDRPSVGVAKNLLCGTPRQPLDVPLAAGSRVAIEADERVDAPAGTVIGYALQSRQYPGAEEGGRHVNPLYVSPGHRTSAETAADLVLALCTDYKLPEPIRRADRYAAEMKRSVG